MADNKTDDKTKSDSDNKEPENKLDSKIEGVVLKTLEKLELNKNKEPEIFAKSNNITVNEKCYPLGRIARAQLLQAQYREKGEPISLETALKEYGKYDTTSTNAFIERYTKKDALQASQQVAGGFLVTEEWYNEVIPLLFPKIVMLNAGVQMVQLGKSGSMHIPKESLGYTVYRQGETGSATLSTAEFSEINLHVKKLVGLGSITNDLIRYNSYNADARAQNLLIKAMAKRQDYDYFYGDGTEHIPLGIQSQMISTNTVTCTTKATATAITVKQDLLALQTKITNYDIDDIDGFYVMHPSTLTWIKGQAYTTGYPAEYATELENSGKLFGKRVFTSTQIAKSTSGHIFYVVPDWLMVGIGLNMQLEVFLNATYIDASGTAHYGVNEDVSAFRAITEDDIALGYNTSVALINNCDWQS